jgi:hypothetical protein
MPSINIPIDTVADLIKHMNKKEIETLSLLLSKEGKTVLKRKKDIESKKVKTLSRDDVFNV